MKTRKKVIVISLCCAAVFGVALMLWNVLASSTCIAFVNYQATTLGQISKSNDSDFVKIAELDVNDIDKASGYDMVFVNGMGLRITDEQRQVLIKIAGSGTPVLTTAATNPLNQIMSVDSVDHEYISRYLTGGRTNYRNLLRYVRKYIDGKKLFVVDPGDPVVATSSLLYYPADSDDLNFESVEHFEAFLKSKGKWKDGAPRIILTGAMGVPDSLVASLERTGNIVYPVNVIQKFISAGHADSVAPSALINLAHGRMGDMVVDYLSRTNIPLFSPVNVNCLYDEWMANKMGMSGGFLSQSVVTPEIDGALRPFSLFAHYEGEDGLQYVEAIPDRLKEFTAMVNNYIALQTKPNKDKKLAIFYFKGPGQNSLVAEGMEVAPSLFNMLAELKRQGYTVDNLPADAATLEKLINENGRVFGAYAEGAKAEFIKNNNPQSVSLEEYDSWCAADMPASMRADIDAADGPFPGHGMSDAAGNVAIARLQFGNIVLVPQTAAGIGDDDFKIVHGTNMAPPHAYVASYLWARHGFGADAFIHFGTHGSLEFTPRKQAALGSEDWPDRLVGTTPHFYLYAISNVGEAMIAKRRSYAGLVNYLTPPFMESNVRGVYKNLMDAIADYNRTAGSDNPDERAVAAAARLVKKYTVELGIHRELRLDSTAAAVYNDEEITHIENFADELVHEKVTGAHYVLGEPYNPDQIRSTVEAMTVDPLAYSLHKLAGGKGKVNQWREKARMLVHSGATINDAALCHIAGITQVELDSARSIRMVIEGSKDMLSRMMVMGAMMPQSKKDDLKLSERKTSKSKHALLPGMTPEKAIAMARKMGASEENIKKMEAAMKRKSVTPASGGGVGGGNTHGSVGGHSAKREITKEQMEFATAVGEVETALTNVYKYRDALINSPSAELAAIVNALNGGYVAPTSGGDPVLNPNVLPTGRNMFAINAEETPSTVAWEKGKTLADRTLAMYRRNHNDSIPRKVSYTLWSSEFIETEGATIAQVLYMLGVEPVRDAFGRVTDLKLISGDKLGRSRIDVVVQTSGQLRDLAASRLFLISRAVEMAASATNDPYPNYVAEGVVESERHLVNAGVSPKEARELSTARVFGGVNGNYGTGIQSMVEAGDRWDKEEEIAGTYINNMGAIYGSEDDWEKMREHVFEAALTRTDIVVQPRQSNTWGALSLDHVYEFMGGMNLAVRNVTGKDPEAYLSDYRNRSNVRMQEIKEAIGVESRTTILNPSYIKEKMKGGAGDASSITDVIRNTYGWNVMKPDAIDDELWDDIYETYVEDKNNLGVKDYFMEKNPAAIQEMTAVMLETARKGMWNASPEQLAVLADLHTEMVEEFGPACSGFVCDNAKLREFIAQKVPQQRAQAYNDAVATVRAEKISGDDNSMVMKREEITSTALSTNRINGALVAAAVVIALVGVMLILRNRRKKREE